MSGYGARLCWPGLTGGWRSGWPGMGATDVVRQELASELAETRNVCGWGLAVSLRTVERACAPYRQQLLAST